MHGSMVFCCPFARMVMTTCPHRCIMPKTGGRSLANGPRPPWPLRRLRRPVRPWFCITSGCPLWPATTDASSHSPSFAHGTLGFFSDAFTSGRRPLGDRAALHVQLVGKLVIGYMPSHKIPTQHPHF